MVTSCVNRKYYKRPLAKVGMHEDVNILGHMWKRKTQERLLLGQALSKEGSILGYLSIDLDSNLSALASHHSFWEV